MFTDNSTAECVYFKGTSRSRHLFELVLRLRKLEMQTGCRIYLVHVAGTRMIAQGSDGLSRGDQNAGVMAGRDMLSFVPLNLSAFDRSSNLKIGFFRGRLLRPIRTLSQFCLRVIGLASSQWGNVCLGAATSCNVSGSGVVSFVYP